MEDRFRLLPGNHQEHKRQCTILVNSLRDVPQSAGYLTIAERRFSDSDSPELGLNTPPKTRSGTIVILLHNMRTPFWSVVDEFLDDIYSSLSM